MQADWEIEVGGDTPVIDAAWAGLVNLRAEPDRAHQLPEARALSALAEILIQLNTAESPVWTSKCDIWTAENLAEIQIDHLDLDATEEETASLLGCYVDILPHNQSDLSDPAQMEKFAKTLCANLQEMPLNCCRVDLVIRQARLPGEAYGFGITAYWTAAGGTPDAARDSLAAALHAFTDAILTDG